MGLKAWSFKSQHAWLWESLEDIGAAPKEEAGETDYKHKAWKQRSEEHLGHTVGRLAAHTGACPREAAFMETPQGTKELAGAISPLLLLSISTRPAPGTRAVPTLTTTLLTPSLIP